MRVAKTLPLCAGILLTLALIFILFARNSSNYLYFPHEFDLSQLWYHDQAEPSKQMKSPQSRANTGNTEYTINPTHLCEKYSPREPIEYLVMIFSAPRNILERNAIRETWASELKRLSRSRTVFLLAKTDDASLQEAIEGESYIYSDIVQGTHVDSYRNQTLKAKMMFKWALKHCSHTRFLIKTDDDTYLNVPLFLNTMKNKRRNAIHGFVYKKPGPNRNPTSKWFVSEEEFDGTSYPDFIGGAFYAVGWTVVDLIYEASRRATFVWLEDVFFTGFCAYEAGVDVVHDEAFSVQKPTSICHVQKKATSHYITAENMRVYWYALHNAPVKCR